MRLRKFILFLCAALIFPIFSASALASLSMEVITDDFYLSPGSYKLTVQADDYGYYGITALGSYRSWVFFRETGFYLFGKKDINFTISPPERAKSGTYDFPIMVYSVEDESKFYIKEYRLIIEDRTEAKIAELTTNKDNFMPGETIRVNATIRNSGTSDIEELKLYIKLTGSGFEESREKLFSLNVGEEKIVLESFDTSLHPEPGNYEVNLILMKSGQKMDAKKRLLEVERFEKIEETLDESWNLIQESGVFYLKNVGNVQGTKRIEMEISKPWDWFAFFSENPETIDLGGKVTYVWLVTLSPGESRTIEYEMHYWPFIIIAIVILYGLYLAMRQIKKPSLKKHSIQTKIMEDDKREVMVAVEVKSGGKKMKDVVVEDRIPSIAHLINDFKTIKPSVRQGDEGTILKWRLKDLDKRENIILTYKFRTMIGTVDHFRLPKAVLKAKVNNVMNEYFSNSLRIKEE